MVFNAADVGLAEDLRMCDSLDVVDRGIRDLRDGDVFDLAGSERMAAVLPNDVSNLGDVDRILGH